MIYRLDNAYDARGNAVYDQVGLRFWGPHRVLGDGVALGEKWKPLAVKVHRERGRRLPDVTMMTGYALVATEQASELLTGLAGEALEPLELKSTGPRWFVLNVVDVVDRRSEQGRLIFKRSGVIHSPVFVSGEFKACLEAEGLEGLRFRRQGT